MANYKQSICNKCGEECLIDIESERHQEYSKLNPDKPNVCDDCEQMAGEMVNQRLDAGIKKLIPLLKPAVKAKFEAKTLKRQREIVFGLVEKGAFHIY
ncbi:hypothetical protein [Vibrio barjaei]|uniref:hypothetical protein n=1 Tax=Vibrio barjaei TaxID=1676683 RepID=UPI0022851A6F|nr:hypothetical protein [Vibrio barjaei]MCY9873009.1 hypothetical protein [Vibrio barjaei]